MEARLSSSQTQGVGPAPMEWLNSRVFPCLTSVVLALGFYSSFKRSQLRHSALPSFPYEATDRTSSMTAERCMRSHKVVKWRWGHGMGRDKDGPTSLSQTPGSQARHDAKSMQESHLSATRRTDVAIFASPPWKAVVAGPKPLQRRCGEEAGADWKRGFLHVRNVAILRGGTRPIGQRLFSHGFEIIEWRTTMLEVRIRTGTFGTYVSPRLSSLRPLRAAGKPDRGVPCPHPFADPGPWVREPQPRVSCHQGRDPPSLNAPNTGTSQRTKASITPVPVQGRDGLRHEGLCASPCERHCFAIVVSAIETSLQSKRCTGSRLPETGRRTKQNIPTRHR
ncbi:hypothetical protein B0I35DRAFT_16718 [Stachybotrys elegans]|uniref:Uncharacterized protein n=1 Tax=Stachybotrys elegans TaxID=80388 RepID=A0A8K0T3W9_9HYPO|nr:hypothetical protein B0I35DRAFT_16718 [Stachybotrys elegans]